MIKKIIILLFFVFTFYFLVRRSVMANNIFGLHLTQTEDIKTASNIINSGNGDWGWATIVIRVDQLNKNQWQDFFNQCRRFHIIPILRLASKYEDGKWMAPSHADIDNFANFLSSLNWPTLKKHIILYNEMNRGDEWQGQVSPSLYADIAIYASQKFKSLDENFFILSGGLDLSAPHSPPNFYSADLFYQEIMASSPSFFDSIDGLASHSYPNHGFVGKPTDTGRHSIKGYQWELDYIKNLGISKTFPVFITETGWPHREGIKPVSNFYTANTSASFLIKAIDIWQKDDRVQAITPFTYNYPQVPFDHFSWLDGNNNLYPAYKQIVDLPKSQNRPNQTNLYVISKINLPLVLFPDHTYHAKVVLKNTGQAIWSRDETIFCLDPQSTQNITLNQICTNPDSFTEPGQNQTFDFTFTIKSDPVPTKTLIGWQGIDTYYEIKPIIESVPIFRPQTGIFQKITTFFKNLF